jgi:HEAT repeat protein
LTEKLAIAKFTPLPTSISSSPPPNPMSLDDLTAAIAAADSGMWSIVVDILQTFPIVGGASDREHRPMLDLALQVLLQGDFEERWAIAKIIPKLGEIAILPLLDILNDRDIDPDDRWFVARILGEFKQPQVAISLVSVLQREEDPELSAMITNALAQIGTPAIAALTELLQTPNRRQAISALAQIRHSQTIEPLLIALDDADPQIRTTIVEALGSFHDPRILPLLLDRLTDLAASVRKATVIALTRCGKSTVELDLICQLRPLLYDLDLDVCIATALGLAQIPDPQVVTILTQVERAERTPDLLRSAIIMALGWIGSRAAIVSLAQMLPSAPSDRAREIIASIGKTEIERVYASQQLIDYLNQGGARDRAAQHPATIAQAIVATLGNLGNIEVVEELVPLLGDPDDRVRFQTIATISKLSPTIPTIITQLADRISTGTATPGEFSPALQAGIILCLAHWKSLPSQTTGYSSP